MDTINISLPKSLATKLDSIITTGGYASRSEFVRSLLRDYLVKNNLILEEFKQISLETVYTDLVKAGHDKKTATSIVNGLKKSSVYAKS